MRLKMRRSVVTPVPGGGEHIRYGGHVYEVEDDALVDELMSFDPKAPDPAAWPEDQSLPTPVVDAPKAAPAKEG